ncbi:MAG TPA: YcaO-like family protein [Candidatus Paceibacterota bacterium]|nr:YcaO-like family protein [Candidatus Paceibacterota bacterium]
MNHIPEIQDPRRLETVISPSDFAALYVSSSWKRELLGAFFEALGKRFGTDILLRVPDAARGLHPAIFKDLPAVQRLRERGLLTDVGFLPGYPDEPALYRAYAKGASSGSGAHFSSPERALWSALGECIERSLWFHAEEWYGNKTRPSLYRSLPGEKLDPSSISGFSEAQKEADPLLATGAETVFEWIRAKELISDKDIWVPLQLLSAEYANKKQKSPYHPSNTEPLLRPTVTTGLATGATLEEATLYGALEVIERDAFMIAWLNNLSSPRLDPESLSAEHSDIAAMLASFKRHRLRAEMLLLPTDFPVHVVAGVLIDETCNGPAFTVGAKAHWDIKEAVLGAFSESTSVRYSLKKKGSEKAEAKAMGRKERLAYWAEKDNLPRAGFFTRGDLMPHVPAPTARDGQEGWQKIIRHMAHKRYRLFAPEISSPASRSSGFRSVYVFSPDLQPLHLDERAPCFGGPRLSDIPRELGYAAADTLNPEPHPFP